MYLAIRLSTGRHPAHGWLVGALLLLAAGFNLWMLPYPIWFEVAMIVCLLAAAVLGCRAAQRAPA